MHRIIPDPDMRSLSGALALSLWLPAGCFIAGITVLASIAIATAVEPGGVSVLFGLLALHLVAGLAFVGALIARMVGVFDRVSDLKANPVPMLVAVAAIAVPLTVGGWLSLRALAQILEDAH